MENRFLKIGAVVICVMLLAGGVEWWMLRKKAHPHGMVTVDDSGRPLSAPELINSAIGARNDHDDDLSIAYFTKALEMNPEEHDKLMIFFNRALEYARKSKPEMAIDDLSAAVDIKPDYVEAREMLGSMYSWKGQREKAMEQYDAVLKIQPNNARMMINRGQLYQEKGENDKALAEYNEVLRLNPHNLDGYEQRASVYREKNETDKAMADYEKMIEVAPNDVQGYISRSDLYQALGDKEKAMADLDKAISVNPRSSWAYSTRAQAHKRDGDWAGAKADLIEAVNVDPRPAWISNSLAWMLATCPNAEGRDGKLAVDYAKKACDLTNYKQKEFVDTLAAAYAEAGDFSNAVKYQQQFIDSLNLEQREKEQAQKRLALYQAKTAYHEGDRGAN